MIIDLLHVIQVACVVVAALMTLAVILATIVSFSAQKPSSGEPGPRDRSEPDPVRSDKTTGLLTPCAEPSIAAIVS